MRRRNSDRLLRRHYRLFAAGNLLVRRMPFRGTAAFWAGHYLIPEAYGTSD
jgi:hypothetical protein